MPIHGIHDRAPIVITGDAVNRFWEKVVKGDGDNCWNWTAAKRSIGYGCLKVARRLISAHRFSYVLHFGDVPDGLLVLHRCDNRACVRPDHLFAGTPKQNVNDMDAKGRCERVHGENHPHAKLTEAKVAEIVFLRKMGMTFQRIADSVGVAKRTVENVLSGQRWKRVTDRLAAEAK